MATGFTYKKVKFKVIDDNTVCVAKNDKFVGPLIIPETIEKNGVSYRVTAIESSAFSGSEITSVEIPGSIKEISIGAFSDTPLEKVSLNEGIERICYGAFGRCKITSVCIPGSVVFIDKRSFYECALLEEVLFEKPSAITTFYPSSFEGSIWQSEQLKQSGTLIVGNTLVLVNTDDKAYQVPDEVESISPDAFINCESLKEVCIPEGITELSSGAFNRCHSLEIVNLPASLKKIGDSDWRGMGAFDGCGSLKELIIPEGVEEIGAFCFRGCGSLEKIILPASLHSIGRGAFSGCTALKDIIIPKGVSILPRDVFFGCKSLTSVLLPESLAEIGESAFNGCLKLSSVIVPGSVKVIGKAAFCDCSSLVNVVLSDGLEIIQERSFGCCSSLESISIPKTVKQIEKNAFWSCCRLREVTIPDSVPLDKASAFSHCTLIGKKVGKEMPKTTALEILSDPYECDCFINLTEKDVQPYLQEEYQNPLDDGFDSDTVSFIKWGRYRTTILDGKEISIDSLFNRPMEYWGHQWQGHFDDLQEALSRLLPGHYGIIDRREMYKNSTVFHIELNGAPFNKYCLKLLKMSDGDPVQRKLVPNMSMSCNKLLYCGSVIKGEFQFDMGSQGRLLRIVFLKEDNGKVKIVSEYTY